MEYGVYSRVFSSFRHQSSFIKFYVSLVHVVSLLCSDASNHYDLRIHLKILFHSLNEWLTINHSCFLLYETCIYIYIFIYLYFFFKIISNFVQICDDSRYIVQTQYFSKVCLRLWRLCISN